MEDIYLILIILGIDVVFFILAFFFTDLFRDLRSCNPSRRLSNRRVKREMRKLNKNKK